MNLKKTLLSLVSIMIFSVFILAQNTVYATTLASGQEVYMGIIELMTHDTPNMGYAINKPGDDNAAKIWNIVKYKSATSTEFEDGNIYCIKAGIGFTQTDNGNIKRAAYNVFYDMKTEREQVKAQNRILNELANKTITENGVTINCYDALLAVMDRLYLPGVSTLDEKEELTNKILKFGIQSGYTGSYMDVLFSDPMANALTDNDINAIQQAVIWYFTNYGEDNGKYDKTGNVAWINYTLDGTKYDSLENYNPDNRQPQISQGQLRSYQGEMLYNYLIKEAKENASQYTNVATDIAPVKINTTVLNNNISGENCIVGPINMTEVKSIPYTIDFKVSNSGNEISGYKLLDENKNQVSSSTKIEDLVGKDFYISLPKNQVENLKINIKINYNDTTVKLWTSSVNGQENSDQPLVEISKTKRDPQVELSLKLEEEKTFDLALRKYITKINGVELQGVNSRVPSIEEATLTSGNTATYRHRKAPLTILTGDKVTYKLTIYNEGEKAGYATKVVDQLPTGLKYTKIVSGNFVLDSYDESTNTLNLKRNSSNTEQLPAYTPGNLASETIEIECEVTAIADSRTTKVLTNVAWISEEYDAEDRIVIINQENADRDSVPADKPSVNKDNMSDYTGNNNKADLTDSNYYYKGQEDDEDFEKVAILPESFDLKIIKHITSVNNKTVTERIESIDASKLNTLNSNGEMVTTAEYDLNKEPVTVKKGDIVTYTFRIYNEGTIDGYAEEITEQIPEGLEFLWSEKVGQDLKQDTTLTDEEKEAIEFNQEYLWGKFVYDEEGETIVQISSDYLSKENETTVGGNLITAFGRNDGTKTENNLSYKEIAVKLKVVSDEITGTVIRNEAAITEDCDKNGNEVDDRDSSTTQWVKYEDDEDYDNIILQSFDLAARKFIIAVSNDTKIEDVDYLKNEDGAYTRAPQVDTSKLNTKNENGELITTAIYNHKKESVLVKKNDIVVYMIRVYNEGEIDGYAAEIKDHLPSYLEFVDGEFNKQYGWEVSEDGRTLTTKYLENSKIVRAQKDINDEYVLFYKEVPVMCRVKDTAKTGEQITNIADIAKYLDENKVSILDRDSAEDNVILPEDNDLPKYKDNETGSYIPGQEDDDDFEKIIIKRFDLALRKFITKIEDKEITSRIPEPKIENGKITYEHDKTPLEVVSGNIVTYTIRVYNEGELSGYATEITDDIPDGLEFLPENELNKTMKWKMIDEEGKETDDVSKAVKITTDYLSENLLQPLNNNELDYADVEVAFKVIEPNSSDKTIINSAQISQDSDDDEDSIPSEWNEGEDDQDKEYIKLVEFDLALRKWVTEAIVIEDGTETVTQTGHQPYDDPEQVVKVEIHRKKLNQVTVKFKYSIRVINEGNIAGYAKEVTDYVPEGLKFVVEDNPEWTDKGNGVISTRSLENTLLQPGEYADVEVILTWINSEDNMGVMINTAEISEDDNEYDAPDKDSTPDNKKDGEDDIDDAPVMLSISTGKVQTYFTLGFIVLITIAGGVVLIKKYVL